MPGRPSVGTGIIVQKNGCLLMGQRVGAHGKDTWSVPGGYLEYGETFEECAARETLEETGITITNVHQYATVNNIFVDEGHHSITIFMMADWESGEPQTLEPDKFINVGWYDPTDLPQPLFVPMLELQKAKPELFQ